MTHSVDTVTDSAIDSTADSAIDSTTDSAAAVEVVGRLTRDGHTIEGRKVPTP
ncbi:hypothetical protein [Streptomyces sp. B6B3]|uniref:hypothetical protein n=1 Tax=Streptomyces sp. B6B3 TaxID=3153570 RepID=UPI00325DD6C2